MHVKYKTREQKVQEFHEAFKLDVNSQPRASLLELRKILIMEEAREVSEVLDEMSMSLFREKPITPEQSQKLLKELCDLQYVLSGTVVALRNLSTENFDAAFNLVHKSNMSKLDKNGDVVYDSKGKVLKSSQYQEPDLSLLV